jgi:hypothetical protein
VFSCDCSVILLAVHLILNSAIPGQGVGFLEKMNAARTASGVPELRFADLYYSTHRIATSTAEVVFEIWTMMIY